jgi:hypothetical protein
MLRSVYVKCGKFAVNEELPAHCVNMDRYGTGPAR